MQSPCWLITRGVGNRGYARSWYGKKSRARHVEIWEFFKGPVPEGKQLDHLCRVKNCGNITHLEAVTSRENTLRGNGITAINARRDCCINGHPFTPENTYRKPHPPGRACRECMRIAGRARRRKPGVREHDNLVRAARRTAIVQAAKGEKCP